MKLWIAEARGTHIPAIAANARQADRDEMEAFAGLSVKEALEVSLANSTRAWTVFVGDEAACMCGVTPMPLRVGRPWMIGTNVIDKYQLPLLRACRPVVQEMRQGFTLLENFVDARNTRALRWLKWLGFEVDVFAVPAGVSGMPFYRFEMEGR
jgi:hypothetical protein